MGHFRAVYLPKTLEQVPLSASPTFLLPSRPLSPLRSIGPLNTAIRGLGSTRCKLPQRGLGRSPSRNRIWCILALESDIW